MAQRATGVVVPPAVTKRVLAEASDAGIRSVWLQPGTFDQATFDCAVTKFDTVVAGFEGNPQGQDGWCGQYLFPGLCKWGFESKASGSHSPPRRSEGFRKRNGVVR